MDKETHQKINIYLIANQLLRLSDNDFLNSELMHLMKLQKMLYLEQGFHLAVFDTPLFDDEIEAWQEGPVVPSIFKKYQGSGCNGIVPNHDFGLDLADEEASVFLWVFDTYNPLSDSELRKKVCDETPWRTTPCGKGNVISKQKMMDYFKTLLTD